MRSVLSRCNTRLTLLYLLYDVEKMWWKAIKHAFSMVYTLIKKGFWPIRARAGSNLYHENIHRHIHVNKSYKLNTFLEVFISLQCRFLTICPEMTVKLSTRIFTLELTRCAFFRFLVITAFFCFFILVRSRRESHGRDLEWGHETSARKILLQHPARM